MTAALPVFVPGPWWHPLSYAHPSPDPRAPGKSPREGARLFVPVGRGKRVGFVAPKRALAALPAGRALLPAGKVLDDVPPLGEELWRLAFRIGDAYLCGAPFALALLAPRFLLRGEGGEYPELPLDVGQGGDAFCYDVDDAMRVRRYIEMLETVLRVGNGGASSSGSALVLFPEEEVARRFFLKLPSGLIDSALLWPHGARGTREAWERARRGEISIIVGSRGALFAPLPRLRLVLVDDEASGGHAFPGVPGLHARSVAALRARLCGGLLFLGGRMPSARVFLRMPDEERAKGRGRSQFDGRRLVLVDLRKAHALAVEGCTPVRVSEAAFRETERAVAERNVVLWILDRKGYAGEIACEECGASLSCSVCGNLLRVEQERFVCTGCGRMSVPVSECPRCRGLLLSGTRPGIDALFGIANGLLGGRFPVGILHGETGAREKRALLASLREGGVVVGTRRALALCDLLPVGVVVWLDADAEARHPRFDARFAAFRMIWESFFRGGTRRSIVLQSRMPGKGWQQGLALGWTHFWERELAERRPFDFPPFSFLVEICTPPGIKQEISGVLERAGLVPLEPDASEDRLLVRSGTLAPLREILFPFFRIARRSGEFPRISLCE